MAAPCLYTTDQLEFVRRSYLGKRLPPREVARLVNDRFQTNYSAKQMSSLAAERGWSKRRKIARIAAANSMETAVLVKAEQRAELASVRDIVAGHERLGRVITAKAEKFAHDATSAKTLSSAASAARTGISIQRQALGLDSPGSHIPMNATFHINFAHSDESPFSPAGQERARLAAMKKAEPATEGVVTEPVQDADLEPTKQPS